MKSFPVSLSIYSANTISDTYGVVLHWYNGIGSQPKSDTYRPAGASNSSIVFEQVM